MNTIAHLIGYLLISVFFESKNHNFEKVIAHFLRKAKRPKFEKKKKKNSVFIDHKLSPKVVIHQFSVCLVTIFIYFSCFTSASFNICQQIN